MNIKGKIGVISTFISSTLITSLLYANGIFYSVKVDRCKANIIEGEVCNGTLSLWLHNIQNPLKDAFMTFSSLSTGIIIAIIIWYAFNKK